MTRSVYYLGPPGTFGEQAALRYLQQTGLEAETVPLSSHPLIVRTTDAKPDALGIVAIENSLGGAVEGVLDAILAARHLKICAELVIPIQHDLIVAPGTRAEDVAVVMSHPQALEQCRGFLEARMSHARQEAALSTAGAVEQAVRTPNTAAIGPRRAAEVYGGTVLAAAIQDVANNKTRFLVLAHTDASPTGDDKTSLAFTLPDRPGSLVRAMSQISDRNLNLTRIESRPSREELGKYVFLIDFQGHRTDPAAREALDSIVAEGATLLPAGEPLGSYPRFVG